MRISVSDPASRHVKRVYLDGARRVDVLELDTIEGWVDVIVLNADGSAKITGDGEIATRRIYGRVSFEGVV